MIIAYCNTFNGVNTEAAAFYWIMCSRLRRCIDSLKEAALQNYRRKDLAGLYIHSRKRKVFDHTVYIFLQIL